jgi:hypothetical protein
MRCVGNIKTKTKHKLNDNKPSYNPTARILPSLSECLPV